MRNLTYAEWQQDAANQREYAMSVGLGSGAVTITTFPPNVPNGLDAFGGMPALRYSNAAYGALANAGYIDLDAPQVPANSGAYMYVVAPASAADGAPQLMTAWQRFQNAAFTVGDETADAVGLGGMLETVDNFIKDVGKEAVMGIVVAGVIALVLRKKR